MLLIAGIDPGATGAIGIYDFEADKLVSIWDLPNFKVQVGKTMKTRLDVPDLHAQFAALKMMGVRLVGIENVQGGNWNGRKQSASGAFQFGYTFGLVQMAAEASGIPHDLASPAVWKLQERVPRHEVGIVAKADKDFPEHRDMFHTTRGRLLHDRAEAAFLARYFARIKWPAMQPRESLRKLAAGLPRSPRRGKK